MGRPAYPRLWQETITCRKCDTPKFYWEFDVRTSTPNGRDPYCKPCKSEYQKARYCPRPSRPRVRQTKTEQYAKSRQRNKDLKQRVIIEYGGKCACCGESEPQFLTIGHINRDGRQHRKEVGNGGVYWHLKRLGFPKDKFRLECMNCNFADGMYGSCPHKAT